MYLKQWCSIKVNGLRFTDEIIVIIQYTHNEKLKNIKS